MEDTLRAQRLKNNMSFQKGLNPCFNGRHSQRAFTEWYIAKGEVLILVLMEDTLRGLVLRA